MPSVPNATTGSRFARPPGGGDRAAERDLVQLAHRVGDGDARRPRRPARARSTAPVGRAANERNCDGSTPRPRSSAPLTCIRTASIRSAATTPGSRRHGGEQPCGQRERRHDEQVRLHRAAQRGDRAAGRRRRRAATVGQRLALCPMVSPGDDRGVAGGRADGGQAEPDEAGRPAQASGHRAAPRSTATSTPAERAERREDGDAGRQRPPSCRARMTALSAGLPVRCTEHNHAPTSQLDVRPVLAHGPGYSRLSPHELAA